MADRWLGFIFSVFYLSMIGLTLQGARSFYKLAPYLPLSMYFSPAMRWSLAIFSGLLVIQFITFVRALGTLGGTTVVSASPAGIRFRKAPARPCQGYIAREDFRGLYVNVVFGQTFRKRVQLAAAHRGGRQILLTARHRTSLVEIRDALASAMGITVESDVSNKSATDGSSERDTDSSLVKSA
jgi:hypothetical protein